MAAHTNGLTFTPNRRDNPEAAFLVLRSAACRLWNVVYRVQFPTTMRHLNLDQNLCTRDLKCRIHVRYQHGQLEVLARIASRGKEVCHYSIPCSLTLQPSNHHGPCAECLDQLPAFTRASNTVSLQA